MTDLIYIYLILTDFQLLSPQDDFGIILKNSGIFSDKNNDNWIMSGKTL